jgi:chemotaxis signal transduction protein
MISPQPQPANRATHETTSRDDLFSRPLPAGYRDELQALAASPPPNATRHQGSMLLFQVGELRLALPTHVAAAVAPVLHIARIPHRSGTVLLGLAAFRGELLPCCSLARILDVPAAHTQTSPTTSRTLILQEAPRRLWALPIDAMLGVRAGSAETSTDEPAPLAAQWLRGSFHEAAGNFYLLDHEVLFRQINLATA